MDDNKEMQECPKDCKCPMCPIHQNCAFWGRMNSRYLWVHIIIKILVAIFIFWCGVQFGELKGAFHGGYPGYRAMGLYGSNYSGPALSP